jgi:hypothetical protein
MSGSRRFARRRVRVPEPAHGPVVGTLAGAAPPWMESWLTVTPPSDWNLDLYPSAAPEPWDFSESFSSRRFYARRAAGFKVRYYPADRRAA